MHSVHGKDQRTRKHDSGFALMEVIIAIAIIGIVAISSITLTVNGIASASMQERRQIAVTIASGAMENISAQTVATLYDGRRQADVQAAFTANSTVPGIAAVGGSSPTYARWDAGASASSIAQVPVTSPAVRLSGTLYSTTTLIGPCYQPTSGGDCATLSSHPNFYGRRTGLPLTHSSCRGCSMDSRKLMHYLRMLLLDDHSHRPEQRPRVGYPCLGIALCPTEKLIRAGTPA